MEANVFAEAASILRSLLPGELGELRQKVRRYGMKVWFGPDQPPRDHYEAQVIGPDASPEAQVLVLEVGFHAEHPDERESQAVLDQLLAGEARWRGIVGAEATAGPFLGRATHWRRISETWPDPDLGDPELVLELGTRLTDYITAIEPLRR